MTVAIGAVAPPGTCCARVPRHLRAVNLAETKAKNRGNGLRNSPVGLQAAPREEGKGSVPHLVTVLAVETGRQSVAQLPVGPVSVPTGI